MFGTNPTYTPTTSSAAATLADIYDPTIFNAAVQEQAIELNRFVASGIMQRDARIDAMASGAGSVGDLPFFHGLNNDEPNYVTDNPATTATPAAITSSKQVYASAHMHKSWSTMDLARELGLQDPLGAIIGRVAKYWAVNGEKRLINSLKGVMADNIANDSSDMVNAIHSETGTTAVAANKISAEAVIDAAATMGDHAQLLSAICMHSVVYTNLQKQNLIDFIPDARGEVNIPTYLGYRLVVDDSLAPRAGTTDGYVYTTVLCGMGAVAFGSGMPMVPSEIERAPNTGNGGGQDIIHSRATEIVHPFGFAFDTTSVSAITATYAELAAAGQWNRVFTSRKNVGIAFLTTNG
ncbi:MAG: hypothetical protein GY696_25115 [Gammaproteobacteria bacterium]|nr:hypothetical protein [Gammaproteobacteria bacterium]